MKEQPEIKAVEMTRRIRDAHHERLRDASREERLAFFNEAARRAQQDCKPETPAEKHVGSSE